MTVRLRAAQDEAYAESLAADQEKERRKEAVRAERQQQQHREQLLKEEEEQRKVKVSHIFTMLSNATSHYIQSCIYSIATGANTVGRVSVKLDIPL